MKPTTNTTRKKCECGCGEFPASPKSRFKPGHDAKLAHKLRVAKEKEALKKEAAKKSPKKAKKRELATH